jgi:hypothetical protein
MEPRIRKTEVGLRSTDTIKFYFRKHGRATRVDSNALMRTSPAFWATLITPCVSSVARIRRRLQT